MRKRVALDRPRRPVDHHRGLAALAFVVVATAGIAEADGTYDYVVQDGDTCVTVVVRELGDRSLIDRMHELNPQLGPVPHTLVAGQVLKLPVGKPDAELTAPRGIVEVRRGASSEWSAGSAGQDLFRTWRVGTRERSGAVVVFADRSTIDMRADTVVVIFGPSAANQASPMRTAVERGQLRSRLAALDGKPRVAVTTPQGTASLVEGSAVLEVESGGETRLSNHTGKSAALANAKGRVAISPDYGSTMRVDKPPAPPRLLPAPPAWVRTSELVLAWRGEPPVVRGAWAPVGAAVKYRIEIARRDSPTIAELRLEVPASITRLEANGLPIADYAITVASVDAGDLEGRPSDPLYAQLLELDRPAPVTGARLAVPPGLSCSAGRGTPKVDAPPGSGPSDTPPGSGPSEPAPERPGDPTTEVRLVRDEVERAHVTCTNASGSATLDLPLPPPIVSGPRAVKVGPDGLAVVEISHLNVAPEAVAVTGRGVAIVSIQPSDVLTRVTVRAEHGGALDVAVAGTPALAIPIAVGEPASSSLRVELAGRGGVSFTDRATGFAGAELQLSRAGIGGYVGVTARPDAARAVAGAFVRGLGTLRPIVRLGMSADASGLAATVGFGGERRLAPWLVARGLAELTSADSGTLELTLGLVATLPTQRGITRSR